MSQSCLTQIVGDGTVPKAGQLVGKNMILKFGKSNFIGIIMGFHGKKGVVIVKFRAGALGARERLSWKNPFRLRFCMAYAFEVLFRC